MTVNPIAAAAAYARPTQDVTAKGIGPHTKDPAQSFADLVGSAVSTVIETGRQGEAMTVKAVTGEADLRQVVTAVTNAEVTLQTAIAIRDRVIEAYQDIMRMSI